MLESAGLSMENRITVVWDKSFLYSLSEEETQELSRWMNLVMVEPLIWEVESELVGGGSGRRKGSQDEKKKERAIRLGRKLEKFPACLWQEDTVEMLRLQLMGRVWPRYPSWNTNLPQIVPRGATPGNDYQGNTGWMIDQWQEQIRMKELVNGGGEESYRNGAAWRKFVEGRGLVEWYELERETGDWARKANNLDLAKLACSRADAMLRDETGRARSLAQLGLETMANEVERRIREWRSTIQGRNAGVGKFSGYWRILTALEIFGSLLVTRSPSQREKKGNVGDLWYLRNLGFTEMFITGDKQQYQWAEAWAMLLGMNDPTRGATRVLDGHAVKEMARKTIKQGARQLYHLTAAHRKPASNEHVNQGKRTPRMKGIRRGKDGIDGSGRELMRKVKSFAPIPEWRRERTTDGETRSHILKKETEGDRDE